jgi:hypothetical protein
MSIRTFFDTAQLNEIIKYHRAETPMDAFAFIGNPRKHPYDEEKFMLFENPLDQNPSLLEFRLRDIVSAESLPSPVTVKGEGIKMVRVWIRKGSYGMRFVPFEVADSPVDLKDTRSLHARLSETNP